MLYTYFSRRSRFFFQNVLLVDRVVRSKRTTRGERENLVSTWINAPEVYPVDSVRKTTDIILLKCNMYDCTRGLRPVWVRLLALHSVRSPIPSPISYKHTYVNYRAKWPKNAIGVAKCLNGSATVRFSQRGTLSLNIHPFKYSKQCSILNRIHQSSLTSNTVVSNNAGIFEFNKINYKL